MVLKTWNINKMVNVPIMTDLDVFGRVYAENFEYFPYLFSW